MKEEASFIRAACMVGQGFFFVFSGAAIRPHSQWNLGDCFPSDIKIPIFQKKEGFFLLCFRRLGFSFSHHTHKVHGDNLLPLNLISPFNFLMANICLIANLFFH